MSQQSAPPSPGVNWVMLAVGFVPLAVLMLVLYNAFGRDPRAVPSMLEGRAAPQFSLTDLDGNTYDLASLSGRKVVLNFWSTWCLPCRQEYVLLQQAGTRWPNVQFLGIIYQDTPAMIRGHLSRAAIPASYPNLIDPKGHVALDYGVAGVPETFFVDEKGQVAYKHVGPLDPDTLNRMLGPTEADK